MTTEVCTEDIRGLYTAAMLAELLEAPIVAIRRWHRRGYLVASQEVGRLAYFSVEEVHVARLLNALLSAGCSLGEVDGKMAEFARQLPDVARPLCELPVVVEGSRILIRRGDELAEASGQLLLGFDSGDEWRSGDEWHCGDEWNSGDEWSEEASDQREAVAFRPTAVALTIPSTEIWCGDGSPLQTGDTGQIITAEQHRELAADLEGGGQRGQAIEVLRSLLVSGRGTAEDHFTLGELLYRDGDLLSARERYYMAVEMDDAFVEARANLGCVLGELGEVDYAEAALRGALEIHDVYADAHFHLARLLDRQKRRDEARYHWRNFLDLAPHSPWVDEAEHRLAVSD